MLKTLRYLVAEGFRITDVTRKCHHVGNSVPMGEIVYQNPNSPGLMVWKFFDVSEGEFLAVREELRSYK